MADGSSAELAQSEPMTTSAFNTTVHVDSKSSLAAPRASLYLLPPVNSNHKRASILGVEHVHHLLAQAARVKLRKQLRGYLLPQPRRFFGAFSKIENLFHDGIPEIGFESAKQLDLAQRLPVHLLAPSKLIQINSVYFRGGRAPSCHHPAAPRGWMPA